DGAFLDAAVASALEQTVDDLEVVIVDDGSTDGATCRLLAAFDRPRTRVLRLPGGGVSRARNAGIAAAGGRLLLPLDADDVLEPAFVERTAAVLDARPDVGLVETEAELFGDRSGPWDRPGFSMPELLLGNTLSPCSLFRAEDFRRTRGYDPGMERGWEDFDLWLSLVELGLVATRVPDTLFRYRVRRGSRSDRMTAGDWRRAYARILRNHPRLFLRHPRILPRYALRLLFASPRRSGPTTITPRRSQEGGP
ncbi:MAG TPA: glycosyltransferase family A protein, partial [Vicinamibacteria bacterium]|nr:glycosyltransferase family A protein [Vicinamibacteria bacterium]